MNTIASFIPNLEINVETPLPMQYQGKQVYAKLIDFGALPNAYGVRAVSHDVPDIEWKQISWDFSYLASSTDGQRRSLGLVCTPGTSSASLPWRFYVDRNSIQVNVLVNVDYREWDSITLCLLYTRAGQNQPGGSLIQPGPDGHVLMMIDGQPTWTLPPSSGPAYELCEFYFFRNPALRPGFQPAHGELLENAASLYPEAWAFLQTAEGQTMCLSEEEWQAMTTAVWHTSTEGVASGWDGVGGAPYFAPNLETGALRLPDLRGMYAEAAGFDGLEVGGVHGDAIRNITGSIDTPSHSANYGRGAIYPRHTSGTALNIISGGEGLWRHVPWSFSADRDVPTASKNQPRAWGALPCVYLGRPASGTDGAASSGNKSK